MPRCCPQFDEIWKKGPQTFPEDERREDRGGSQRFPETGEAKKKQKLFHARFPDLDSAVSSGGLDQILAPPASQTPNQPRTRSFFRSVTVTKVLRPDGVSSIRPSSVCLWRFRVEFKISLNCVLVSDRWREEDSPGQPGQRGDHRDSHARWLLAVLQALWGV